MKRKKILLIIVLFIFTIFNSYKFTTVEKIFFGNTRGNIELLTTKSSVGEKFISVSLNNNDINLMCIDVKPKEFLTFINELESKKTILKNISPKYSKNIGIIERYETRILRI